MTDATSQNHEQSAIDEKPVEKKDLLDGEKQMSLTLQNLFVAHGAAQPTSMEDSLSYSTSSFMYNHQSHDSIVFGDLSGSTDGEVDALLDVLDQGSKELHPIEERA